MVNTNFVFRNANPNDIRLYQLKAPLVYTERVQPIALPLQDSDYTGEVISSGWGYTTAGLFPHLPETLQFQISNMPDRESKFILTFLPNTLNKTIDHIYSQGYS